MGDYGIAFALIIVLILAVIAYAARRFLCATGAQLQGYWQTQVGDLFKIQAAPQNGGYAVVTTSGYLGADPNTAYALKLRGCRTVEIEFPSGTIRGKAGIDRRRLIWNRAPTWYRQGV